MAIDASPPGLESAQPFSLGSGSTGVLLIHGFMGTPGELQPLGAYLAERGYSVHAPLLARHGQTPAAMAGGRWTEWYASTEQAWRDLIERCDRVFVIGFSMGGLLALHLAAQQRIDGVIGLAAALQLQGGWPLKTLGVARYAVPWFYPLRYANFNDPLIRADIQQKAGQIDLNDPAVVDQIRKSVRIPTGAIYELVRLGARVRRELPSITTPALILQGRRDETVMPISAQQIHDLLGSKDKRLVWFERSGHQLPNDVEHRQVWQTAAAWLDLHTQQRITPAADAAR